MPATNLARCIAACLLLSAAAGAQEAPPRDRGPARPFVISGQIVPGWIESCDEDGFTFIADDGGAGILVGRLPWDTLPAETAARVRARMLPRAHEPRATVRVETVRATRLVLKNGKTWVGIRLPDLDTPAATFLRTRTAPALGIPRDQIARAEEVEVDSREVFTPVEVRARLRAEIRPTTGAEYMEFANRLYGLDDYEGAIEAYERASILDAAHAPAAKKQVARCRAIVLGETVAGLATGVGTDVRGERYQEALDTIVELARLAPDDPLVLRLQSRVPELKRRLAVKLRRDVVAAYHLKMEELIRACVYGRPVEAGSPSGVLVTTTTNAFLKGRLINESPDALIIEIDGSRVTIERSAIARVERVPLRQLLAPATYDEARAYVTDTSGGLAADTLAAVVKQFAPYRLTEADVKQLWGGRLEESVKVTSLGVVKVQAACPYREVSYGKGTWLRAGSATTLDPDADAATHADLSKDANRWFKAQPFELRYQILRAIAAEAQCAVEKVYFPPCNHCGGTGYARVVGALSTPQGTATATRVCPTCRGLKRFATVRYR